MKFSDINVEKQNLIRQFYLTFPNYHALRDELTWMHYRLLMKVGNKKSRQFYLEECVKSDWSTRQLERQITASSMNVCCPARIRKGELRKYQYPQGRGFKSKADALFADLKNEKNKVYYQVYNQL